MPTKRTRKGRSWAGQVQWEQINDPFMLYLLEGGIYIHSPFRDPSEFLASYPSWRGEYLEYKRQQHGESRANQEPPLERLYREGNGITQEPPALG